MTPPTGTALLILAVFVLPGFVTLLFRERMFMVRGEDTAFERRLNALFYSALVYAIALGVGALLGLDSSLSVGLHKADVVAFYKGGKPLGDDLVAAVIIMLALPFLIALVGLLSRTSAKLRPAVLRLLHVSPSHKVSSAWNEAFGRETTPLVRVTLKDGRVVGGYFGTGSLAGYSEHAHDLSSRTAGLSAPRMIGSRRARPITKASGLLATRSSRSSSISDRRTRQPGRHRAERLRLSHGRGARTPADRKAWRVSASECCAQSEPAAQHAKRRGVERETSSASSSACTCAPER